MIETKEQKRTFIPNNTKQTTVPKALFMYLFSKIEKVTSALFTVTSYFPSNEPLRISIRRKGLDILSQLFNLRDKFSSNSVGISPAIIFGIEELRSLVSIGHKSSLLSDMNFRLIDKELNNLLNEVGSCAISGPSFSDSFFYTQKPLPEPKEKSEITKNSLTETKTESKRIYTRRIPSIRIKRRMQILKILEKTPDSSVKAISKEIKGCSKKTLQRELNSLVDEGIIKREGEKRWRVYSLNKI